MAALMYVDQPGYAALLLRRTYPQLSKADGLIPRSHEWLANTDARWNAEGRRWTFPSGATLEFGHVSEETSKYDYQGAAYQFVGADELTQFSESMYDYIGFSRARRTKELQKAGVPIRTRASSNPGGEGHCVPYGEVLTSAGWKQIQDFVVGDDVFAVDPEGMLVPSRVEQVHRLVDEVVVVDARGFHMAVTPSHRVAKVGGTRGQGRGRAFSLVPFQELPGQATILRSVRWDGAPGGDVTVTRPAMLRASRTPQPNTLSGEQYARFLGWYLTEGCLVDRDRAVNIAQSKPESRERLRVFLEDCGFTVSWSGSGAILYAPAWWQHLKSEAPGLCRDKRVPARIKNGSVSELGHFLDAAMDGDGHWATQGKSGSFYSTSQRFADDFAEIAVKLGYIVFVSSRQRPEREGPSYMVSLKRTKSGGTELLTGNHLYGVTSETKRRTRAERLPAQPVYCIGLPPHHAFVIRQRGSVWVSGNSWVKARYITSRGRDVVFVPAKVRDNPGLDADEYVASLQHLTPQLRAQLLDGDWGAFEGAAFEEFQEELHVLDSFPLEQTFERFECMDYGLNNPTAWHLVVVDFDGNLVFHDSHYEPGLPSETALAIHEKRLVWGATNYAYADPSIQNRIGTLTKWGSPATIASEFSDAGINLILGNNNPRAGYGRLRELIHPDPARRFPDWHPRRGEPGSPRLFVVGPDCPQLVEQLKTAPLQPIEKRYAGEMIDPSWESRYGHGVAAARYGVMSRPEPSAQPEAVPSDPRSGAYLQWLDKQGPAVRRLRAV